MVKRLLVTCGALLFSTGAFAIPITFTASYTVTSDSAEPGLVIDTADVADNPFTFDLDEGESERFSLFRIWTLEGDVGGTDEVPYEINVDFNFTAPAAFSGTGTGTTFGVDALLFQWGEVDWEPDAFDLHFGNGGLLRVKLFDEKFNGDLFSLDPGKWNGTEVDVRFKLLSAPTASTTVPEPSTLALLGVGLLGLGVRYRRRSA